MTKEMVDKAYETILVPTIRAMEQEGRLYKGCLYAGLMITDAGPRVVEFNARFGDPETQVVLPLLESDLVDIMLACADGTLAHQDIQWSDGLAVCVVIASGGYPKAYEKGKVIHGMEAAEILRGVSYSTRVLPKKTTRSSPTAAGSWEWLRKLTTSSLLSTKPITG